MLKHEEKQDTPWACPHCPRAFSKAPCLQRHLARCPLALAALSQSAQVTPHPPYLQRHLARCPLALAALSQSAQVNSNIPGGQKKNVTQETRSKLARNKDNDLKIGDSIFE